MTTLWGSKEYRDSVDRVDNKLKFSNILFGYDYNKSFEHLSYNISSPLFSYQFNPVEGSNLGMSLGLTKRNQTKTKKFDANVNLEFKRNKERYEFLKWGQEAFENFSV